MVSTGHEGPSRFSRICEAPVPAGSRFRGPERKRCVPPDDALDETEQLAIVLEALSRYTSTPDDCYFCVWEGWGMSITGDDVQMVKIPTRNYWLFRGAPTDFGDPGPDVRFDPKGVSEAPAPAFIWPADHAWCFTHDVDPHFAMIAGPAEAIDPLIADPRFDAVIHDPETEPPYYY